MIIKSIRTRTTAGINKLINHILHGEENERVELLYGTEADIRDMHRDAKYKDSTYAVRHWIISPHEKTTRQQLLILIKHLANEFKFDPRRSVIIEHKKRRATLGATDTHWHVIVGEADPATGKILRSSFDHILHELVARLFEYKFGHPIVLGKHTKAVVAGLKQRGFHDAATQVAKMANQDIQRPQAAYTHGQHQEKKRKGIDLPLVRAKVRSAFKSSPSFSELIEVLAANHMFLREGNRPGTWIVTDKDDELIGALHRLAGVRKSDIEILKNHCDCLPVGPKLNTTSDPFTHVAITATPPTPQISGIEVILRKLADIEQIAASEINAPPPSKPEIDKNYLLQELSDATSELALALEEQSAITNVIFDTKTKWWWRLTGKLAKWTTEKQRLENELAKKDREVAQAQMNVNRIALQQQSAASTLNKIYKENLQKRRDSELRAKRQLSIVEAARDIIAVNPHVAQINIQQLLTLAESQVDREHTVDECPKVSLRSL